MTDIQIQLVYLHSLCFHSLVSLLLSISTPLPISLARYTNLYVYYIQLLYIYSSALSTLCALSLASPKFPFQIYKYIFILDTYIQLFDKYTCIVRHVYIYNLPFSTLCPLLPLFQSLSLLSFL